MQKLPPHYWILWGVVVILAAANITLFAVLFEMRSQVAGAAAQAANILQQAGAQSPTAPLTTTVTIDDTFVVPIKTTIPVQTTVNVPVTIPIIGQAVTLEVPIDTTVPIDVTVRIPVKKSIPISTNINTSALSGVLQQLHDWLAAFAVSWGAGGK